MRRSWSNLIAGALSLHGFAQQPLNLGFEMPGVTGTDHPWGWEAHWMWNAGTSAMDSTTVKEGRYSFRLDLPPADSSIVPPAHAMMMRLPAASLQGKRVALTVHSAGADACVYLNTWGEPGQVDSVVFLLADPSTWRSAELALPIGANDYQLVITVQALSSGPVWFDAFTLTADGTPLTELPSGTAPSATDLEALRAHTAPIDVLRLPATTDDPWPAGYDVFDRIVGPAQVVSLGESTHGTHEFFVAKHHLFRYLVERKGFTVFAIEANQLATERINAYVHGAPDTVERAMGGLFGVWYKQEVKDLIEWMRAYNARAPKQPLSFVGFDMQDPQQPMDSLVAYLRRHDPAIADEVRDLLAPHREAWRKNYWNNACWIRLRPTRWNVDGPCRTRAWWCSAPCRPATRGTAPSATVVWLPTSRGRWRNSPKARAWPCGRMMRTSAARASPTAPAWAPTCCASSASGCAWWASAPMRGATAPHAVSRTTDR
jgi:hypothetical protein